MTLAVRIDLHLHPDHLDGPPRLVVPEEDEAGVGYRGVRWCRLDVHQAAVLHDEPAGVAGDPVAAGCVRPAHALECTSSVRQNLRQLGQPPLTKATTT